MAFPVQYRLAATASWRSTLVAPDVARGVLTFAKTQATTDRGAGRGAGQRSCMKCAREMAALGEIPVRRYYGSADATPLFVMLASAYFERTGDAALIDRL